MGIFRTSSQGDSISRNPERTPKRQGEVPGYIEVLQQMTGHLNIKRLLLKKTRWPKSRNLALFYVWEAARVWVHWNHSFDTCLSFQGPVSCFHLPKFLRAHQREWLQSDGHKMASILCLFTLLQGGSQFWLHVGYCFLDLLFIALVILIILTSLPGGPSPSAWM